MKALITADLHLSANPRDAYRFRFMERLPGLLRKYGVDWLLVLGDLTEEKDHHGSELVNRLVGHFYELAQVCPLIIMRGNHDGTDPANPFYAFMKHIENIEWINVPTAKPSFEIGPTLFLPHTSNYKRDWASFDLKNTDGWIFAHNTFAGAETGFGHILDGIPTDVFAVDATVISGDVHVPQTLGPVRYVGAPFLVDFGDDFEPRILLIDDDRLRSIKLGGPQKRLITVTGPNKYKGLEKCSPGDILKVRVDLRRDQAANWPEFKQGVREWGAKHGYVIDTVQPAITELQELNKVRSATPRRSDDRLLKDYAKLRSVDEATLKTGEKLMESV